MAAANDTQMQVFGFPGSSRTIGANQSATTAYADIGIQRRDLAPPRQLLFGP